MRTSVPKLVYCATFTTLVSAAMSGAALAANTSNYPGAVCQPSDSGTSLLARGSDGSIQNLNFVSKTVICPMVRDNNTTAGIEEARMYGKGPNMTCQFFSRNGSGGGALPPNVDTATIVPGASFTTYLFLEEGQPPQQPKKLNTTSQGYAYIQCNVPSFTIIYGYAVDEL